MKKIIRFLFLPALCMLFAVTGRPLASHAADAAQDSAKDALQEAQKGLKDAMSEIISATGGITAGVGAGMQEGARKIQEQLDGMDGVRLVTGKDDLAALVKVSVLRRESLGEEQYRITLAVRNMNDFPVRLVNLAYAQSVLLIDAGGFAYDLPNLKEQGKNITVPASAAVRVRFDFERVEGKPAVLRLYGTDFTIP
ncbi:hypothetical protein FACS1894206_08580 [Deltaproteobacteria bacterium]|nr:hypothetical protein FACS1894206_08580 [Deltaproteobacteria bacterium]